MLSFKTFIKEDQEFKKILEHLDLLELEEAKKKTSAPIIPKEPDAEGKVSNNTKGVLHELLVGMHLNNGNHMEKYKNEFGETPEEAHDRLKATIHPNDYEKINRRAKSAANDIRSNLEKTHPGYKIDSVIHTSKPGDTEKVTGIKASQKEDPSDIYISTSHPKLGVLHHGISLKVSDRSSKNIPDSSLGIKSSGEKAESFVGSHKKSILRDYPILSGLNSQSRKDILKSDPNMKNDIKKRNGILLNKIAHSHAAELQYKLDNGDHKQVIDHIREVLHAHQTPSQSSGNSTFYKHISYETAKGTQHHTVDPSSSFEHILKDHKNISVGSSGASVHFYHTNPETGKKIKFATQSHKFDSQSDPLSSLKSAGKSTL